MVLLYIEFPAEASDIMGKTPATPMFPVGNTIHKNEEDNKEFLLFKVTGVG